MSISIELLKKWMEEARSHRFFGNSNDSEEAIAAGNYNVYLSWIQEKIFLKLGCTLEKNDFNKIINGVASLIEMGIGNCGVLSAYIYFKALEHSMDCRKNIGIMLFRNSDDIKESHQCFVYGINREKDGTLKKPIELYNDDSIVVDPWRNTIHFWKELKDQDSELHYRYFAGVSNLGLFSDERLFPSNVVVPDIKDLADICQQFSNTFDQFLVNNIIPTPVTTRKVISKYILKDEYRKIANKDSTPDTYGFLVDTTKATEVLVGKLLETVTGKNRDEARMRRIFRLLKHLDPNNKLLANTSPAYVCLYLARTPKLYSSDKPQCIDLLVQAFEAAKTFAGSEKSSISFIQKNALILIEKLTAADPTLLNRVPADVQMALKELPKKDITTGSNTTKEKVERDNTKKAAPVQTLATAAAATDQTALVVFTQAATGNLVTKALSPTAAPIFQITNNDRTSALK